MKSYAYHAGVKQATDELGVTTSNLEKHPGSQASASKRRFEEALKKQLAPSKNVAQEPSIGGPEWNLPPLNQGLE